MAEPKFKVGDIVVNKSNPFDKVIITRVEEFLYYIKGINKGSEFSMGRVYLESAAIIYTNSTNNNIHTHILKEYVGFTEAYKYCSSPGCDHKEQL